VQLLVQVAVCVPQFPHEDDVVEPGEHEPCPLQEPHAVPVLLHVIVPQFPHDDVLLGVHTWAVHPEVLHWQLLVQFWFPLYPEGQACVAPGEHEPWPLQEPYEPHWQLLLQVAV